MISQTQLSGLFVDKGAVNRMEALNLAFTVLTYGVVNGVETRVTLNLRLKRG